MAPLHFALLVLVCLIWSLNFVVAKLGIGQFPPVFFTFLRFAMVAVLLLPFLKMHPGRMRMIVAIALLAGALHFAFVFAGLQFTDVSVAGIVSQLHVPFVTLLSIVFLGEIVRWKRWLGLGLSFLGVTAISMDPSVVPDWRGVGLIAAGCVMIAGAVILMRRLRGVTGLELQAWVGVISAPFLLVISLTFETGQWEALRSAELWAWGAVSYTAIASSIIAHVGIFFLIQRYEASLVSPLTLMAPIFAVTAGVVLLGDPVTEKLLIGGFFTLFGVFIIAVREGSKRSDSGPAPQPAEASPTVSVGNAAVRRDGGS